MALVDPDLVSTQVVILPQVLPCPVCGLTVISVNLLGLNNVIVDEHDKKSIIVAPVCGGLGVLILVWHMGGAIDISACIEYLEDP